jgi:hypothetical protein
MKVRLQALAYVLLAIAPVAHAQPATPPARTSDGRPDFHGVWASRFQPWLFQRANGAATLVVDDKTALALARAIYERDQKDPVTDPGDALATIYALPKVNGEWRTSMLTTPDGIAPLTEEAKRLEASYGVLFGTPADNPETRDFAERCFVGSGNAPFGMFPTENLREFIQTPDHLVIYSDDLGDTRIIGIGANPRPSDVVTFLGDSTARWDGDVLVVETRHTRSDRADRAMLPGLLVGAGSIVTERFSLISPDELLYQFTVTDPALYTRPWSAEYSMVRQDYLTYENACHEGNRSLTHILLAARIADERARQR